MTTINESTLMLLIILVMSLHLNGQTNFSQSFTLVKPMCNQLYTTNGYSNPCGNFGEAYSNQKKADPNSNGSRNSARFNSYAAEYDTLNRT